MMHAIIFFASLLLIEKSSAECPNGWNQSFVLTNKCYLVVTQKFNWFGAESYCRNLMPNSNLVSVTSAFEVANIDAIVESIQSIPSRQQIWIGLNDIETPENFTWIDGNNSTYLNWDANEPDLDLQCVSFQSRSAGKWITNDCGLQHFFICESFQDSTTTPVVSSMTDCLDLFNSGSKTDGVYSISPPGIQPFEVYCDMSTDGGGWTVFQKRFDDTNETFYDKTWNEYKNGFNNGLNNELWLGNDKIHVLSTKDSNVELHIAIWGYCNPYGGSSACENITGIAYWFGIFDSFKIDNEESLYTFHISSSSTAGNESVTKDPDGIYYNIGKPFSTVDVKHYTDQNCVAGIGGWWIDACTYVALNGGYVSPWQAFQWAMHNYWVTPKQSRMMLRKTKIIKYY